MNVYCYAENSITRFFNDMHSAPKAQEIPNEQSAIEGIALGIFSIVSDQGTTRIERLLNPSDRKQPVAKEIIDQVEYLVRIYFIASAIHILKAWGKSKQEWLKVAQEFEALVYNTPMTGSNAAQASLMNERINEALSHIPIVFAEDWDGDKGVHWINTILRENKITLSNPFDVYIVFDMIQSNIRVILKTLPTLEIDN